MPMLDPEDIIELFEERAAILENDAGMERKRANVTAMNALAALYGQEAKKIILEHLNHRRREGN
jgi:hypothetical protein